MCELVDKMVEASAHLRNILGMPVKEFARASQSDTQMQEEQIVPSPSNCLVSIMSLVSTHCH